MPGLLYHLACGNLVHKVIPQLEYEPFMLGNLIPDFALDKNQSHYRVRSCISNWKIPDLMSAKKELLCDSPVLFGAYCHLVLDYFFINNYLGMKYRLSRDGAYVIQIAGPVPHRIWQIDEFLSREGLYGCYSRFNANLIADGFIPDRVFDLDEQLPLTGLSRFDERSSRNWQTEARGYLINPSVDSSGLFVYEELKNMIKIGAKLCFRAFSSTVP